MSGRALFTYNPDLFKDQEGAADNIEEAKAEEENVDENLFANEEVKEDEEVDFD